jgi:hypothetical protein
MIMIFIDKRERRMSMSFPKKIYVAMSMAILFIVFAATATAEDDASWKIMVSFIEPTQIGGLVLSPGSYLIQRTASPSDRFTIMVYSMEQKRWEGMIMGVPARRIDVSKRLDMTFTKQAETEPQLLEYWFHRHSQDGIKFLSHPRHTNRMVQTASN